MADEQEAKVSEAPTEDRSAKEVADLKAQLDRIKSEQKADKAKRDEAAQAEAKKKLEEAHNWDALKANYENEIAKIKDAHTKELRAWERKAELSALGIHDKVFHKYVETIDTDTTVTVRDFIETIKGDPELQRFFETPTIQPATAGARPPSPINKPKTTATTDRPKGLEAAIKYLNDVGPIK